MEAFVKGLGTEELERMILSGSTGAGLGVFALPFALSAWESEDILEALKTEKARREREEAQRERDARAVRDIGGIEVLVGLAGGVGGVVGGHLGDRGTLGQSGGAATVEPRGAGVETPARGSLGQSGGQTVFEPPAESSGIRRRDVGHAGVEEPSAGASQGAIQRGLRGGIEDVPLEEVVVETPDVSQAKERRQTRRLPRPTRTQLGVGGGIIATIGALWPGAKVVKKNPDGTVDVKDPQGNIHRINPDMFEKTARGMQTEPTGNEFYIKNKYRTPRSGRWDSRLFKKYTDVGAQMANPGGINNNVGRSLDISRKTSGIKSTGRRVQLDDPARKRGLV